MKNLNLKEFFGSTVLAFNHDGRTTVERRSNDGHIRRHLPVGLTKLLSLFLLLTLGTGQMLAGADNTVVGVAANNTNNYTVKLNVNRKGDGSDWQQKTMTKAGITFEGKKLYITSYEKLYGGLGAMQFQYYDGSTHKGQQAPISSWSTDTHDNRIYNYDGSSWYPDVSMTKGARVYFDASTWSQTGIKLVTGHANHQKYYSMSAITNTKLYYGTNTDSWSDAMGFGIVGGTDRSGTQDQWLTDVSAHAKEYTGWKNYGLTSTGANQAYLVVPGGKAGEQPTITYYSTAYNSLNSTQTIRYAVGVNGGTPATLTSGYVPADIAISSYKFSSGKYNAVDASSGSVTLSQGGSNFSATVTAARTATTTYTVSNVHEDYSFLGWYSAASGGTLLSSELSYTFYPTSATTAYARFSKENNHSVTISRYCTSTSTEINNTSAKIGEVTYSSIEAPEIYGYTFVNWTLGSGVTKHSSDALTSNPIRVITAASGDYTLTANYTEVLTTDWKLIGDNTTNSPFGDNYNYASGKAMTKKSGYSTEYKAYKTLDITKTGTWGFKVASSSASANIYGWGTGETSITFNRSKSGSKQDVYPGEQHQLKFNPDGLGEYEFKVDYTASPCSVTVTFPTVYTVTFGKGTGGGTVTAKYSSVAFISGTKVQSGKTVTFTQTASTGYNFKEWNTQSDGKGTQLSTSATYNHTVGATNSVYAIYEPASYDITYNPASSTNFAYTSKPTTGVYNSTVSVTIIPAQNYKITSVTAAKTEASGTSVSVTHTTATNVYSFTQPAYGVTLTTTAAAYGLTATATADYVAKTFTLGNTSTLTPEGTKGTNWFVYYTCTAKPDGANCSINQSTGVATVDKIGNYTFKAQFRTADSGAGTLLAESSGNTIEMKDFPNYSGIAPTTAIIGSSYMNGSGISESPYFVYSSHFDDAKTLTLNISGVGESDDVYCAVDGANEQSMTGSGTSRTATITLPSNTIEANKTTAITVYAKVDGQTAPAEKRATATVYYTVNTDPVVTVTATYNGNPVAGNLPQSATIELAASVTQIPGEPTFTYSKGEGAYTATTSYTINETGTTTMHAKTTYLGDWIGDLDITTYTANAVTLKTVKTDMYGDNAESSTSRLFSSAGESYTAPDIEGYTFAGWSCNNTNVQVSDDSGSSWKSTSSNATVYVKATAAGGTLTATYNENKRIYFDNSKAKWSGEIYVYLFNGNAWYDNYSTVDHNGPGVVPKLGTKVEYGHMTRIGESDIYYYEYSYGSSFSCVAFSVGDQNNYDMLYATKAVWRTDFSTCNPVYVAPATYSEIKYNTGGAGKSGDNAPTYYYNTGGYWRRYMPQYAPYSLYMVSGGVFSNSDQGKFVPENPAVDGENFTKEILLAGTTTYYFNLPSSCGGSYGNNGEMTKDNCTNWTFEKTSGSIGNCRITTTAEGTYVFHLSTANGQVKLSVDYPLSVGDYRIHYTDATGKNDNYSDYIRKNTGSEAKKDTVSFFVAKNSTPKYQVEKCNSFDGSGNPEWITVGEAQSLSVDKDGVYIFVFEQPAGGESISKIAQDTYSGNYYIRTDGASGGWANYLSDPDNRMKYTDKASAEAAGYNYYYLRWIGDSYANVKFTVANDYNSSVSQEMGNDAAEGSLSGGQALTGLGANVRFTYHSGTNQMTRTYIGGSAHDADYLVLEAVDNSKLNTSAGGSWSTTKLEDQNDWIYTLELRAKDGAEIMLKSHYNNKYVNILPENKSIFESTDKATFYDLKVIYDYKTNEVVAAYIPGVVNSELSVDVDIMFIRKAKDNFVTDGTCAPTTLSFGDGASITGEEKTLYGAIEFEKDYVRGEVSYSGLASNRPQRSTYWISFPFDVRVRDIFGLGDYTDTWILQRYRGDERARKGWFLDTPTFWEYILDQDYVLKAGQGYVLSLDCEAIAWPNGRTTQYLYFPSKEKVKNITSVLPTAKLTVPEYRCSITSPADRTIKDANWNVIGIPGFTKAWGKADATVEVAGGDFHYFYSWDPATNTLSSANANKYHFEFMHSYMVQYAGDIIWSASEPSSIPARRYENANREEVEFRLDLLQGDKEADHTFITLMDNEKVTNGFDMNTDLVKMFNANKPNIYTIIGGDVQSAANCLPMSNQTTIVPMGVQIAADGEYTFAMPDGTNGTGVTLIDNETGTRTSLALTDYTVTLAKGTYDNRFVLEFSPVAQTPTGIEDAETVNRKSSNRKLLIDGILYIVKDGQVFDARGTKVR